MKALRGLAVGVIVVLLFIPPARNALLTGVGVGIGAACGVLLALAVLTGGRRRR